MKWTTKADTVKGIRAFEQDTPIDRERLMKWTTKADTVKA